MDQLRHRNLEIWKHALFLSRDVYAVTKSFPSDERYALCDQLRRAVVSVPSNIAEGSARHSVKDFRHFLAMAKGSLAEVDTQLILAYELGYIESPDALTDRIIVLVKRINAFIASLPTLQATPAKQAIHAEDD